MATSVQLKATQKKAGAPLVAQLVVSALAVGDDGPVGAYQGLGVTTSSTPPATLGAMAHYDGADAPFDQSTLWDSTQETLQKSSDGGVSTAFNDSAATTLHKRLDSNYVAGRYLWGWAAAAIAGTPADTVPVLSAPYHIL